MIRFAASPLRRCYRALAVAAAATPLVGCSGTALVNALTPRSGYTVERDLAYGPTARQKLDLYVPDDAAHDAPVLVFFYGGNWQSGSKDLYRFAGQAFASRGYVTAIPDYRLYPEVRYPTFIEDGALAIEWLATQPGTAGGRKLFVAGHSAGAYIAAMLTLDRRWLNASSQDCGPIAGMAGLAGPYDFLPLNDPTLEEIFGPGPASPGSQPINLVTSGDPPMLLATGTADSTVRPRNSIVLAERLAAAGSTVRLIEYPGLGHIQIVAALAAPLRFLAPALDDVDSFLRQQTSCITAAPAPQAARATGAATGR
jgi:acetyl esterase/lipase